jgi:ABC-type oligopeptide transport system substrate-binding subunit
VVILLAAVALVAGACTGSSKSTKPPKPTSGGILRIGITAASSLDPAQARTVEQLLVADQLFDGLTAFDPRTHKVVPALASRWTVSADQKQFDFFLRPDAIFSNSRPITANDVVYSLNRVAKKGSGSPGAELLELVTGYADTALKGSTATLAGVTAPSPDVVHIALDQPFAVLPVVLSSPVFGVVPQEAVEASTPAFAEQPVGSGPFAVKNRTSSAIHLARAPKSKALLDGIDLIGYDGVAAAYNAFGRGELDWSQVPPEQVLAANRRFGRSGFVPYAAELLYGFNLKNPKFADERFREAIVRAIDRRALVRAVYDDIYDPLDGIVVSGIPGSSNNVCETCGHDVERAKALVTAVYPSGAPEVFLDYDAGTIRDALANAIQADLKEVGITATLRPKPFNDYLNFEVSGQQELFLLGWIAAYPSPEAFLGPLFATGSRNNLVGFNQAAFDTALKVARSQPDDARRATLYQEAERLVLGQVPVIPILQYEVHSVIAKRVNALTLSPTGTFDGSRVWLTR